MKISISRVRNALGAIATTCAVAFTTTVALAAPATATLNQEVPADVAKWFESAPNLIQSTQNEATTVDSETAEPTFSDVTVSAPRQVSQWTMRAIRGKSGTGISEPIEQWIGAFSDRGYVIGTVSAYRTDGGVVELAYFDDNAELAKALLAESRLDAVVYDGPLDAYFGLTGDRVVPLSPTARLELASPAALASFRQQLAARYAKDDLSNAGLPRTDPRSAMAGGGASNLTPDTNKPTGTSTNLIVIGLTLALCSALLLVMLRTRSNRRATTRG